MGREEDLPWLDEDLESEGNLFLGPFINPDDIMDGRCNTCKIFKKVNKNLRVCAFCWCVERNIETGYSVDILYSVVERRDATTTLHKIVHKVIELYGPFFTVSITRCPEKSCFTLRFDR